MKLAHNVYQEQEDKQAAVAIVQHIISFGPRNRDQNSDTKVASLAPNSTSPSRSPEASSAKNVAHNVAMRMRGMVKKFSDAIGEC